MNPWRWWQSTDDLGRVTLYTRSSILPLLVVGPLVIASVPAVQRGEISEPVVITLVATVVGMSLLAAFLVDRQVIGRALGRPHLTLLAGAALVATVIVSLLPIGNIRGPALLTVAAFTMAPIGAFGSRFYVPIGLAFAGAIALQSNVRDQPEQLVPLTVQMVLLLYVVAGTAQLSVWLVNVVRRLADADRTRAELAVAEERLRFARDLHDIVGRDLSAIAVTSDLVAELARRGRPEAAERAEEVRTIAQESLRQVREAVRGYRTIDLRTELEGSAALLRSAGVKSRMSADVGTLPDDVRTATAWVVREGVTNVVRHSNATLCRIEVREEGGTVHVRLENDGVSGPLGQGSGLVGLAERLRPLGGELTSEQRDGSFVLRAEIPAAGAPAAVSGADGGREVRA
ncbi:sensor histidine kinase [Cryptosporangium arvum]|uniref:sensor histidine kinase n=1 Tax=Cryptosporangium arvum TaxID=80871 RepID=UPI0007C46412|nr:sensor histidine kinase [Cryptosporangium arvum]